MTKPTDDDLQVETLSGDIRDALLRELRDMEVGWAMLTEKKQRAKVGNLETVARELVRRVIAVVRETSFPEIAASVGPVKIDKGLEVRLAAAPSVDNITALARHGKAEAILILVDPAVFFGERAPADVDPDEPGLDMGPEPQQAA